MTFRARPGIPSLRHAQPFAALKAAIAASSKGSFRIIHFSVQSDHVHAIVEANDKDSLSVGVAALKIRTARALNRTFRRIGAVWSGKYYARALRTPQETRTALLYVIQNWKKHIRGATGVDGCSSGPWFDDWKEGAATATTPSPVAQPRTWLASKGWRERGGGSLGFDEAPKRPGERWSGQ